jgi:hypothetical protein
MAGLFEQIASYGGLGAGPGAYITNKKFRNSINDFLFGESADIKQLPTMSGEQNQLFNTLLSSLMGGPGGGGYNQAVSLLQQYLDPQSSVYKDFEAPYMQQFNEQILPGIAERFAGAGAMGGGLSSSGFAQALGGAGAGLQAQLAGLKSSMQRQSIGDILGLTQFGLSKEPFAYLQKQATPGFLPQFAAAAAKTAFA